MNKIVEGRHDPNWEQKAIAKLGVEKPPCDHYAVRYMGYIRCRDCHAVWNLGLKGPIWVEADA